MMSHFDSLPPNKNARKAGKTVSTISSILTESAMRQVTDDQKKLKEKPVILAPKKKVSAYQVELHESTTFMSSVGDTFARNVAKIVTESSVVDKDKLEELRPQMESAVEQAFLAGLKGGVFKMPNKNTLGHRLFEACVVTEKTAGFLTESNAEYTLANIDEVAIIDEVSKRTKDAIRLQQINADLSRADIEDIAALDNADSPDISEEAKKESAMISAADARDRMGRTSLIDACIANHRNKFTESSMDEAVCNALTSYALFETMNYLGMLNMTKTQLKTFKQYLV